MTCRMIAEEVESRGFKITYFREDERCCRNRWYVVAIGVISIDVDVATINFLLDEYKRRERSA